MWHVHTHGSLHLHSVGARLNSAEIASVLHRCSQLWAASWHKLHVPPPAAGAPPGLLGQGACDRRRDALRNALQEVGCTKPGLLRLRGVWPHDSRCCAGQSLLRLGLCMRKPETAKATTHKCYSSILSPWLAQSSRSIGRLQLQRVIP